MPPTAEHPQADPHWGRPPSGTVPAQGHRPLGFRWIAVRPGAAPPHHRGRRVLGPTPRYAGNPGWGLVEHFGPPSPDEAGPRRGASESFVRTTLVFTAVVLAVAAFAHALRYTLLIINRDMLLNRFVAGVGFWFGVAASVAAVIAVIGCAVVVTGWLIPRRAAVFAHHRADEPRPVNGLRAGCLIPIVNLFWAPVFVIETATIEGVYTRLRRPIIIWWLLWVASTLISIFAVATSFTTDAQGIGDNTLTMTIAYLVALATVIALLRVYDGFVRKPVDRPAHRWVVVGSDAPPAVAEPVEPAVDTEVVADREPAA